MLTVLDLFSGIGGFSLGLERTGGFKTVAFCEIDPFCRKVLAKHWPDVPVHEDITTLRGEDVGPVDVIAGGFPCQDISTAGRGDGIEGSRSGLWSEFARLIGELRPRYVIVENVAALLGRGLDRVLGDLAALGFDAEWHGIPIGTLGAPHNRDRIWILAYTDRRRRRTDLAGRNDADRTDARRSETDGLFGALSVKCPQRSVAITSDTYDSWRLQRQGLLANIWRWFDDSPPASSEWQKPWPQVLSEIQGMDDGISSRLDRAGCDATGNSANPQIVELIGHAILEAA